MDYFVACLAFPGALIVLSGGVGLMVDRLASRSLPGPLLVPVGFAGLVVLTQLLTRRDGISDLTPFIVLMVGLAGLLLGRGRLPSLRRGIEPAVAFVGAYGIAIAPILFLGRPTILGYLRDTSSATHIAGAYGLIDHGASFAWAPATSDGNQLRAYFDNAYPSGGHTVLGGVGKLFSTDLIWLFQPYLAVCLAVGAPSFWLLSRRLGMGRALAVVSAVVASVPAITYAYALQGSIKEITLIPTLAAFPALLAVHDRWLPAGARAALPMAVLGGAAIGSIGVAAGPWVLVAFASSALLTAAYAQRRGRALRSAIVPTALLGGAFCALILPVLVHLAASVGIAKSFSQSNAVAANDPGNLLAPLHAVQAFGVWVGGDHRLPPYQHFTQTYLLIGVVIAAFALGVVYLWRRGAWTTLAWLAGTCLIWWALTKRGTLWTDAKLITLVAPMMVFVAFVGAASLRIGGRVAPALLALAISGGVLWSDAVLYHETNPMPTARYDELLKLDKRFAGQGPAFTPEFDEYLFTAFRRTHVVGLGYAYDPAWVTTRDGSGVPYGFPVDFDGVQLDSLEHVPLIIERTSPEHSRPPSNFRLAYGGQSWQVWRRSGPPPLEHLGLGGDGDPTGVARCADVRRLGRLAVTQHASLIAATRPPILADGLQTVQLSPGWPHMGDGSVLLSGPGRMIASVRLPRSGMWNIWLRGDIDRPLTVQIDGRVVGSVGYQTGGMGNYALPVRALLAAGRHEVSLFRGGGSLHPGDGGRTALRRIVFQRAPEQVRLQTVPAARWRDLCGRKLDWIEVAAPR